MTPSAKSLIAVLMIAALGAGGCSTVSRLNPFKGKEAQEVATEGDRISILSADQKLEPAEALKGVDFALPPPEAVAAWPLPGGTSEQSMGNITAAPGLTPHGLRHGHQTWLDDLGVRYVLQSERMARGTWHA